MAARDMYMKYAMMAVEWALARLYHLKCRLGSTYLKESSDTRYAIVGEAFAPVVALVGVNTAEERY